MKNGKRFVIRCSSLFFGFTLLFSLCFSVLGDSEVDVTGNTEVIETGDQTSDLIENTDGSISDLESSVQDPALMDGDQSSDVGETDTTVVIQEVVPESVEDLTINANEVVLYSLLPEEDVYPSGAPLQGGVYMNLDTVELGEVLVYVPVDYQYDSFTLNTNGQPINITASQISGYSYDGNDYNIRWSSFGIPTYRSVEYDYGTTYQTLTVNEILGTNIGFWAEGGVSYNYMLLYIILGGLILLIALKIVGM